MSVAERYHWKGGACRNFDHQSVSTSKRTTDGPAGSLPNVLEMTLISLSRSLRTPVALIPEGPPDATAHPR